MIANEGSTHVYSMVTPGLTEEPCDMMSAMSIEPESRDSVGASFPRESLDITGLPAAVADELRRLVAALRDNLVQAPSLSSSAAEEPPQSWVRRLQAWVDTHPEKGKRDITDIDRRMEKGEGKRDITDIDRQEPVGPERTQTRTDVPFPFPFSLPLSLSQPLLEATTQVAVDVASHGQGLFSLASVPRMNSTLWVCENIPSS